MKTALSLRHAANTTRPRFARREAIARDRATIAGAGQRDRRQPLRVCPRSPRRRGSICYGIWIGSCYALNGCAESLLVRFSFDPAADGGVMERMLFLAACMGSALVLAAAIAADLPGAKDPLRLKRFQGAVSVYW